MYSGKSCQQTMLENYEQHALFVNSLKSKNTNHLNLFTFRHKQEEHRAVEEGDHDQAGEVGTMMIKLGRWGEEEVT